MHFKLKIPVAFFFLPLALPFATPARASADPVTAFILRADSLAQAGGERLLTPYVIEHSVLVGAAVGQLLDVALQVGDQGNKEAEKENIDFAKRLSFIHRANGGSAVLVELVRTCEEWTGNQRTVRQRGKALEERSVAARNAGDLDGAAKLLEEAKSIYAEIGDRRSEAVVWGSLGVVYWYAAAFDSVIASYEKALAARRAIDDRILEGKTLNGLGSAHLQIGDYTRAVEFYTQSISLRRRTGDVAGLGTSLTYCAEAYKRLGRLVDARESLEEALALLEGSGTAAQMVDVLNGIASLYLIIGRLKASDEAYHKAIRIALGANDPEKELSCRINLATNLRMQTRFNESLRELETARQILDRYPRADQSAEFHRERGLTYRAIGELDLARDDLKRCLDDSQSIDNPGFRIEALINLGYLYQDFGAYDTALDYANRARILAEEAGAPRLVREAIALAADQERLLGRPDRAVELWEAARERDQADGLSALVIQDEIGLSKAQAAMGRMKEARTRLLNVRALMIDSGRFDLESALFLGVGHTFAEEDPDSARHYYETALRILERTRSTLGGAEVRTGFLSGERRYFYEEIARYYADLEKKDRRGNWSSRAFTTIERAKARGLLDLLEKSVLAQSSEGEEALLDSLYRVDAAGPSGKKRMREIEKRYIEVREKRLEHAFRDLGSAEKIAGIEEVRKALPKGTALLEFALGDTISLLWIIDRKGHELHELPDRRVIGLAVERLRDALGRPGPGDPLLRKAARDLYVQLIAPAEGRLKKSSRVVIVPDGTLFEVPFEVLLAADPEGNAGWEELPFLARSYPTVYAPSASVFLEMKKSKKRVRYGEELLALGDPDFASLSDRSPSSGSTLARLPHTRTEVLSISSRIADDKKTVLLGAEANESNFKESLERTSPRIVHLATHGLVDPAEPASSCVALGADGASREDGYLHTLEILSLPLDVALVVISACESGRGKVSRGEGVVGLSRALIASGAGGVVVSLWAVSDLSTSALMKAFYEQMLERKKPASDALYNARLALLDKTEYAHPFYWSPFVVIGTDRSPW